MSSKALSSSSVLSLNNDTDRSRNHVHQSCMLYDLPYRGGGTERNENMSSTHDIGVALSLRLLQHVANSNSNPSMRQAAAKCTLASLQLGSMMLEYVDESQSIDIDRFDTFTSLLILFEKVLFHFVDFQPKMIVITRFIGYFLGDGAYSRLHSQAL